MTSSPDPQAPDPQAPGAPRPAGPVYGREGAYATHPADASVSPDASAPTGPAAHPVRDGAPQARPAPSVADGGWPVMPPQPLDAPAGHAPQGYGPQGYGPQGYAPQGYAPGPQPGYPVRPPLPRNDLAVWSLVLGLLGVLGCVFFTGIPAVVVGQNARRAVAAGEADNAGTATAGIVLGWVATGLGVVVAVVLVLSVFLPLLLVGIALPFMEYR